MANDRNLCKGLAPTASAMVEKLQKEGSDIITKVLDDRTHLFMTYKAITDKYTEQIKDLFQEDFKRIENRSIITSICIWFILTGRENPLDDKVRQKVLKAVRSNALKKSHESKYKPEEGGKEAFYRNLGSQGKGAYKERAQSHIGQTILHERARALAKHLGRELYSTEEVIFLTEVYNNPSEYKKANKKRNIEKIIATMKEKIRDNQDKRSNKSIGTRLYEYKKKQEDPK